MYAIYGNIYHQYTPNVSIYTIHGSYGILPDMAVKTWQNMAESCRIPPFFVGCGPRQNGVIGGQATFFLGPMVNPSPIFRLLLSFATTLRFQPLYTHRMHYQAQQAQGHGVLCSGGRILGCLEIEYTSKSPF